jgi:hypothetical protein
MPLWITVYCRSSADDVTARRLLDGIQGRDPSAPAGVDYQTLAEDYHVHSVSPTDAVAALDVSDLRGGEDVYEVRYGIDARPLVVRRWRDPSRVVEEVQEVVDRPGRHPPLAIERVRSSREVIGIELGSSQLRDMGIVIAYELARYLAQKCDGVILTDEERWLRVEKGEFTALE